MRVLLPPSETKTAGGNDRPLSLASLAFTAELTDVRERTIAQLTELCGDSDAAITVLGLSVRQSAEVVANRLVRTAPTLPAIERYTGVLYDGIGVASITAQARAWLANHVLIQSALFGPIGAADPIPHYRLSASTRLAGESMVSRWARRACVALAQVDGPILDLRSRAYSKLAPVESRADATTVEVLARSATGATRALNHFNKKAKGELVRALALGGATTLDDVVDIARSLGVEFSYNLGGIARLTLVEAA